MILYSGTKNASSWSFRAWLALKEAGLRFDLKHVDLTEPARGNALAAVARFSPSASVPALIVDDVVIFDSMAIMEYANDRVGGDLLPKESKARAVARSLLAWQHSGVTGLCPALSFESVFYENKRGPTAEETADAERLLAAWCDCLRRSGGPYLMGSLSLADLAFVPTIMRIFSHVAVPTRWAEAATWMDLLLQRTSVVEWMEDARRLDPVYLPDYRDGRRV